MFTKAPITCQPWGVIDKVLWRLFRASRAEYPRRAALAVLLGGHIVVLIGVLLADIQLDFTSEQLWRTIVVAEVLMLVDNAISAWFLRRALEPVEEVLSGAATSDDSVLRAWRILVGLPSRHFRKASLRSVAISLVPLVLWISWELALPWWSPLLLTAVGGVVLVYGYLLRFFVFEVAFRPPVRVLADMLPDGLEPRADAISVRRKLLLGVPVINVITATIVAALSSQRGASGLENISADVLAVVVVSTTVSLGLSLLLSRSLLLPIAQITKASGPAREGDFSARVPVMTGDEIGALASGFNLLMAGMEQRGRLEEALGTYVDPTVAAAVVHEDEARLTGSEVDLTVLFLDIRGFTAFAEGAAPAAVVARLNEFFEIVIPAITSHGGQANKFTGDGLLALFGAPEPLQGHADHAIDAALEIVAKVRTRFAGQVELAIGINSGPAVAGRVGGGGKFDFTVIGDTVNTAQRVERATRETGDEILIAGSTHSRLTRDHGGFDERPAVPMSGKTDRVRLWAPRALDVVSGLVAGDLGAVAAAAPDALAGDISVMRRRSGS